MNSNLRERKIGTITLGMSLLSVGIVFMFVNFDSYEQLKFLFSFWPAILVALGAEVLISTGLNIKSSFSVSSIIILVVLLGFAFFMAYMEIAFSYAVSCGYFIF